MRTSRPDGDDDMPCGLPGAGSPSIARLGSIAFRRVVAYSFDSRVAIGMFGVNFGSATYLLRSANDSLRASATRCRYGALLWPIDLRSNPSRMFSASSITKPCEFGGHS